MDNEMRYNCKQLLDLLSIYEGELQAREALIEALQGQQDQYLQQSSSTIQSMIKHDSFNSVLRDSQQIERFVHCASCSNRMLHTAKIMQIQRDSDRKLNKAINLLNKRYAKINQEIDSKERRLGTMAKDNEKYINSLEAERDDCHDQLKKQQNEFAELQEKKAEIDDKFTENDERTKEIILYLLRERNQLFEHLNELRKQIDNSQPVAGPSSILDESKTQIHALKEENRRLQSQLTSVQTEKGSLQKRLDYLLKDLQQSAFHQHFQFLQPKGPAEKELIIIGNGLISPTEPFHGPNRIRNSSSFPQSFGGNDPSIRFASSSDGNGTGRSRMPQQFPTNHFEQRHSGMQNSMTSGGPIPLMASNSTMIMRRLPPPVPRTTAQPMPTPPSNQQEYRRPSNEQYPQQKSTLNTTNIQLGQPQTVITRRSTSLPRRIVSSTTVSPSSKQHSLQHNRKEPSAEHFFYHQQQGGGQGIVSPMDDGNGSHQKQHFVNNHFI